MALSEVYWDHQIPLPKLAPVQAKVTVALVALLCFINSYDGEFVFDDSEAIVNNKVFFSSLCIFAVQLLYTLYCKVWSRQHVQWCPAYVSGTNISLIWCFCFRTWDHQPPWATCGAMTSGEATWVATLVTNPTDLSLSLHFGKGTCPLCRVTHWCNTKLTTNICFSAAGSPSVYIISSHTCQHFNLYLYICIRICRTLC